MFWENFVELCSQNGTSPNAVAAQLGKSSGSVTAWKNGTVPRETTLKKIADYFSVTVDRLIYDQKEKSPTPEGVGLTPKNIKLLLEKMSVSDLAELMADCAEAIRKRGTNNDK